MIEEVQSFSRYDRVAQALHWTIAVLIILNLAGGLFHDALGKLFPVMPLHKAIGLTVLVLTLVRIGWRLTHRAPSLPAGIPDWQAQLSRIGHLAFYALMLLMPLSGWIMSSPGNRPLTWFWLFAVPKFPLQKGDAVVTLSHTGHTWLGYLFVALVALHIAAALHHHWALRSRFLARMA